MRITSISMKAVKRNMCHVQYSVQHSYREDSMMSVKYEGLISSVVVEQCFIDACTHEGVLYLEELLSIPCMRTRTSKPEIKHFEGMYKGFLSAYEKRMRDNARVAFKNLHVPSTHEDSAMDVIPAFLSVQM